MELHSILRCIVMMTRYGDNLETGCPFLDQSMQEKQPVSGYVYTKVYKKSCRWRVCGICSKLIYRKKFLRFTSGNF